MEQHLHREIDELKLVIARLGGLVEEAIGKAMMALKNGDKKLAKEVRRGDDLVDSLEVEIEERLLKMFALYQPVARDLRFLVTALKVNNELEHVGDLAESIASKAKTVGNEAVISTSLNLFTMGEKAQGMLSKALDAFLKSDAGLARQVIAMDDEVDACHKFNHKLIRTRINDKTVPFKEEELGLLSVSRSLERIADTATSIAEDVVYFVDARIVRHRKNDEED